MRISPWSAESNCICRKVRVRTWENALTRNQRSLRTNPGLSSCEETNSSSMLGNTSDSRGEVSERRRLLKMTLHRKSFVSFGSLATRGGKA